MTATKGRPRRKRAAATPDLGEPKVFTNDADTPFGIRFTIKGHRPFLFNAANPAEIQRQMDLPAGHRDRRKPPEAESLVWRAEDGTLGYPGHKLVDALAEAGRGLPDPTKTGRKSAKPTIQQAFMAHDDVCSFGVKTWDCIAEHWVGQRHGGIRRRPQLDPGWMLDVTIEVAMPEWFSPADVARAMARAGTLGIGDGLKLGYGRFVVVETDEPHDISWA